MIYITITNKGVCASLVQSNCQLGMSKSGLAVRLKYIGDCFPALNNTNQEQNATTRHQNTIPVALQACFDVDRPHYIHQYVCKGKQHYPSSAANPRYSGIHNISVRKNKNEYLYLVIPLIAPPESQSCPTGIRWHCQDSYTSTESCLHLQC